MIFWKKQWNNENNNKEMNTTERKFFTCGEDTCIRQNTSLSCLNARVYNSFVQQ